MTDQEREARTRVCDRGHVWLAFGGRGESCAWCSPSVPEDARQLSLDEREAVDDAA